MIQERTPRARTSTRFAGYLLLSVYFVYFERLGCCPVQPEPESEKTRRDGKTSASSAAGRRMHVRSRSIQLTRISGSISSTYAFPQPNARSGPRTTSSNSRPDCGRHQCSDRYQCSYHYRYRNRDRKYLVQRTVHEWCPSGRDHRDLLRHDTADVPVQQLSAKKEERGHDLREEAERF